MLVLATMQNYITQRVDNHFTVVRNAWAAGLAEELTWKLNGSAIQFHIVVNICTVNEVARVGGIGGGREWVYTYARIEFASSRLE